MGLQEKVQRFSNMFLIGADPRLGVISFNPCLGEKRITSSNLGPVYSLDIEKLPRNPWQLAELIEKTAQEAGLDCPSAFTYGVARVDRKYFVPLPEGSPEEILYAFMTHPIPLEIEGRDGPHTCSALNIYAILGILGLQDLPEGADILEIKAGNGYFSTILAKSVEGSGSVTSFNVFPELEGLAQRNLKDSGIDAPNLHFYSYFRKPELFMQTCKGKFDVIISRAALSEKQVKGFYTLLKEGGKMLAPVYSYDEYGLVSEDRAVKEKTQFRGPTSLRLLQDSTETEVLEGVNFQKLYY